MKALALLLLAAGTLRADVVFTLTPNVQ